jgi:hypothetical protein
LRTVAQKMGLKPGDRALFIDAPRSSLDAMALPELDCPGALTGMFDHIHLFVLLAADMERQFPALKAHVSRTGRLWASWPKGRQCGTDLTIRDVIRIGYCHGMVESTAVSVDPVWSALKFTHPKPGKRYSNSYGRLPEP